MNRLRFEKSPYLLQHASNPVDWHAWGEEAFEKAKTENKPIFLSIGYSTCHWCHVMERESFQDSEVAELMNKVFVSIKVDREERPDIDGVYMSVCQMLTGSGGWPLTIIMTPDKKPFFAGTYFPKESRFGRTGMLELIPLIKENWLTQQDKITNTANQIILALKQGQDESPGKELGEAFLNIAYEQLAQRFDEEHGGFGGAPKFPSPHNLLFLLRYWKRTGNGKALEMAEKTLHAMRRGGIYDHIGFGFHRYSTDERWLVPHFEKMLYDQAMIAIAYTEAYQATKKQEFKETAQEIFAYVLRDMASPEGGFYSAEDADSEGVEGKFYLWKEEEVRDVLGDKEGSLIISVLNIKKRGNFADEASRNILHLYKSSAEMSSELGVSEEELRSRFERARQKLFSFREKRVPPLKDDKILTDWNGLMIAALARGAQVFDEQRYAKAAKSSADFILKSMFAGGRLLHRYRDARAEIAANLDDYAFFVWGLLELYEATFEVSYLKAALAINDSMITHFWDDEKGGFYFTADDGESILVRQKEIYDGAMPSGNSAAMLNLLRLGRITANSKLEEMAAQIEQAFSSRIREMPLGYTYLASAMDFAAGPSYEVVVAGDSKAADTKAMLKALRKIFLPNKIVLFLPSEQELPEIAYLAEFTKQLQSIKGRATAYVCTNYSCKLPTTDISQMLEQLSKRNKEPSIAGVPGK